MTVIFESSSLIRCNKETATIIRNYIQATIPVGEEYAPRTLFAVLSWTLEEGHYKVLIHRQNPYEYLTDFLESIGIEVFILDELGRPKKYGMEVGATVALFKLDQKISEKLRIKRAEEIDVYYRNTYTMPIGKGVLSGYKA